MTREEIEESSRKYAFAEQTRPIEAIGDLSFVIKMNIRNCIYLASRNSYIAGAESRDTEIAELVDILKVCKKSLLQYSTIELDLRSLDNIIKKYEQ